MKIIKDQTFPYERALYYQKDTYILNCLFEGKEDGESALKESRNIKIEKCKFSLRYPLWHVDTLDISNSIFSSTCRAPLWYSKDINITSITLLGVKALRECQNISIKESDIQSEEFAWKSSRINIANSSIKGEYAFFESKDIDIDNISFKGKYSFQYVNKLVIKNSKLDTKDAFWHSKDVTIINSELKGEYLAWYSSSLTLINCKIIGTQPLCYCKNLKLIDCEMINTDLSFEYSDVEASIKGHIDSIKNPRSGNILCDSIGEVINKDSIMENKCNIVIR